MGNTFTSLHCHFVFSTKNREPWISHEIEERVWSFLGGIARENGMKPNRIGGMPTTSISRWGCRQRWR
jgi:putative transposase